MGKSNSNFISDFFFWEMHLQQGRLTLVKLCLGPWKGQPRTPGMDLISTASRRHLLGGALMWPGYFGAVFRGLFGLYPSSLSKSSGFVSVSGKTSSFQVSYARAHLAKR